MIVYNIYFILVILLAVIISCARKKFWLSEDNRIIVDNKLNVDMLCKIGFCIIAFGYLIFLASQRYDVGFDYFQYALAFEELSQYDSFFDSLKTAYSFEPGYMLFQYLVYKLTQNYQTYFAIVSIVVVGATALVIFFNSKSVYISSVIFVLLNLFAISMNFYRQFMAMTILLVGFEFLKRKQYFRYMLIALLACTFHIFSFIMFLFALFCFFKPNKVTYSLIAICSLILLSFSEKIIKLVTTNIQKYKIYNNSWYIENKGSKTAFVTFLILSLVIILFYCFSKWKEHSENAQIYFKIAFICAILCFYMRKHYLLDRFNYYFISYFVLSIPDLIEYICVSIGDNVYNLINRAKKLGSDWYTSVNGIIKVVRSSAAAMTVLCVVTLFVISTACVGYYNTSIIEGAHKAYPYKTTNQSITAIINSGKSEQEILCTANDYVEYLSELCNEDYVITVSFNYNRLGSRQYNDIFMRNAQDYLRWLGIYDIIEDVRTDDIQYGSYIIDGGKLVEYAYNGDICYKNEQNVFFAGSSKHERFINVCGVEYPVAKLESAFVVYSKSKQKVIDFCEVMQGNYMYSPTLYHNILDGYTLKMPDEESTYKEILLAMMDSRNTIIMYNNNEDFEGNAVNNYNDKYYNMLGSTITIDALCNQNVAAMRFGGEWREIIYPASPARIEANIDGVFYDVYADSYNSYCKINGVEVASAATGLNVLIISPEGEILFNGSVDVYSNFNEVTVNDEFAYIPA